MWHFVCWDTKQNIVSESTSNFVTVQLNFCHISPQLLSKSTSNFVTFYLNFVTFYLNFVAAHLNFWHTPSKTLSQSTCTFVTAHLNFCQSPHQLLKQSPSFWGDGVNTWQSKSISFSFFRHLLNQSKLFCEHIYLCTEAEIMYTCTAVQLFQAYCMPRVSAKML